MDEAKFLGKIKVTNAYSKQAVSPHSVAWRNHPLLVNIENPWKEEMREIVKKGRKEI